MTLVYSYLFAGSEFRLNAFYGQGTGSVALYNVQCTGTERGLIDCPYSVYQCPHTQDVGVRCLAKMGKLFSIVIFLAQNNQIQCYSRYLH